MLQRNFIRGLATSSTTISSSTIAIGAHVREALANGCPIVALESTVITHGLPEPENFRLALQLEREISDGLWWDDVERAGASNPKRGAVTPATVGIIKGQLVVGLSREELEFLADSKSSRPIKASRRDLPIAQALGLSAGTTVSATMAIATSCWPTRSRAGCSPPISVFATGGLGGVHLGGELSMDISADLFEMSQTPIGLVSSGFKSFLDTRRSLELLETLGCTVVSMRPSRQIYASVRRQQCDRLDTSLKRGHLFPGFFTAACKEAVSSPWQCDDVQEAARILFHCLAGGKPVVGANSGEHEGGGQLLGSRAMLIACPIPGEFALGAVHSSGHGANDGALNDGNYSSELLDEICARVDQQGHLMGSEKTPLILAELNRLTGGKTLAANLELLRNNARIGAHLAFEHSKLCQQSRGPIGLAHRGDVLHKGDHDDRGPARRPPKGKSPIVIGCTMIDMHVRTKVDERFKTNPAHSGVTFDGEPRLSMGGVGRNLAAALELLGHEPIFVSSLAGDNLGELARSEMLKLIGGGDPRKHRESATRFKALNWTGNGTEPSSCFALVLIDSLTGQCEYVVANVEARRAISRKNLEQLFHAPEADRLNLAETPLIVLDANNPAEAIEFALELAHEHKLPVFLEPTDVNCLPELVGLFTRLSSSSGENNHSCRRSLSCISPNAIELETMLKLFAPEEPTRKSVSDDIGAPSGVDHVTEMARRLMERHLPELSLLLVTLDSRGLLIGLRTELEHIDAMRPYRLLREESMSSGPAKRLVFKHYPPAELIQKPVSASGAGDCFAAGFISGLIRDLTLSECVELGFAASRCALMDSNTVPKSLTALAGAREG